MSSVTDAAVMPDGRFVAVGTVRGDYGVIRLTTNGEPDPTFGTNGLATVGSGLLPNGTGIDTPRAVALRPDGGVIVVGSAKTGRIENQSSPTGVAVVVFIPS